MKFPSEKKRKPAKQTASTSPIKGDVAIVGIACRFPGADDYKQFWDNLTKSVNSVREITPDRWDINKHYSSDRNASNKSISKWGGLLDRIDSFDAPFFHISPREAQSMDPQQRMLLEETWHCIEDAGVALKELHEKRTAVYVGVMTMDYYQCVVEPEHQIDGYACLGNYEGILSNRLSYFFDLTGESQSIDAACASSLVALHNARRSLLHGESEYAIAAGVNVICHSLKYISFSQAHMLSPEGQCKTFDAEADGYVPGEGVGVLLLESLENALKKGHHIYGILKGSAAHHNGKTKSITAPQVEAQRQVIEEAFISGHISPESITYVEAHGTGTSLGDPIEVEALTAAFQTNKKQYCYLGSVKTNIGHLEGAAGIAGVIKVLLMMQNKKIPKTLNIKTVNPIIDFENSPFRLADKFIDWDLPKKIPLRRAGISSFGFGGVSSHVVIEEYPTAVKLNIKSAVPLPFVLSAKSEESLSALVKAWQSYASTESFNVQSLEDICYTLAQGRETFSYRFGMMVESKKTLIASLKKQIKQNTEFLDTHAAPYLNSIILCLHPIKSLQYSEFQEICAGFPILYQLEKDCQQSIRRFIKENKLKALYDDKNEQFELFRHFLIHYILSKALLLSGVHPRCLMGEVEGELVETVISGMLDFDIAVQSLLGMHPDIQLKRPNISLYDMQHQKIIRHYRISSTYCKTLMAALEIDSATKEIIFEKSRQLIKNQFTFKKLLAEWDKVLTKYELDIHQILANSYKIEKKQEELAIVILLLCMKKLNDKWDLAAKVVIKNVHVAEIVDLLLDKVLSEENAALLFLFPNETNFETVAADMQQHQNDINPQKTYTLLNEFCHVVEEIPNTGQWLNEIMDGDGFVVDKIQEDIKHPLYVDVGEKSHNRDEENVFLALSNLKHNLPAFLMALWQKGIPIDWQHWFFPPVGQKIPLPVYPFDKTHYWISDQAEMKREVLQTVSFLHPLLDSNISTLNAQCFSKLLTGKEFYLSDHCVQGIPILPAAAYLEMVRAAARLSNPDKNNIILHNIIWASPIQTGTVYINIYVDNSDILFEVSTINGSDEAEKKIHAQGKIIFESEDNINHTMALALDISLLKKRCTERHNNKEIYAHFNRIGLNYGPAFQVIGGSWFNETEIIASIQLPKHLVERDNPFFLHPSMMDGALQTALNLLKNKKNLYLPFGIHQIEILEPLPERCYVYAAIVPGSEEKNLPKFNIQITREDGKILVNIKELTVKKLRNEEADEKVHYYRPRWIRHAANPNVDISGPIFVFDNEGRFVQELRNKLPQQVIIRVQPGDSYQIINNTHYQIDTNHISDYALLLQTIIKQNGMPNQMIYLTNSLQINNYSEALIAEELQKSFLPQFYLSQALIAEKPKAVIQLLCINEQVSIFTKALSGFAKTLTLEHPKIICKIINSPDTEDVLREINSQDIEVRYDKNHIRWIKDYKEIVRSEGLQESVLRQSPVYLITGGAGGLGLIFATHFAEHYQAKLVLTGRSELNESQKLALTALEKLGAEVMYVRSDITKRDEVAHLMQVIKSRFGTLNGVFHAAGVVRDSFILKKTTQEITEVLAPKINGSIYLDELTRTEPLDFFVMFSSMVSVLGNVGQSDYAYGNSFMDAFAQFRERMRKQQNCHGKTIVINWPLWADGGMTIDESFQQWMEITFGVVPISTPDGITALMDALEQKNIQRIVLVGKKNKLEEALKNAVVKTMAPAPESTTSEVPIDLQNNRSNIKEQTTDYLKKVLSKAIHLSPEKINAKFPFEKYGIDSLMILSLNGLLEQDFSDLPKTLFFEYLTLDALADYFIENHTEILLTKLAPLAGVSPESPPKIALKSPVLPLPKNDNGVTAEQFNKFEFENKTKYRQQDIAIIGMSGRYAQAQDLEIFWENLKSGKDSITEIPQDRWDFRLYFDPDKNKIGKSYSKWGGFIDDVDKFDPLFFGISPHEAELMDPQERLFLETSWKAIEDAGYTREMLSSSSVGVFVGVMYGEYQLFGAEESIKGNVMSTNPLYAYIANRVSYYFDLHGPSIALDTMCSSSLTSVHLACQSIHNGECQLAIAGGVNISIHPNKYIFLSRGKFLASDGRCRSFGDGGDGYVPGEGVGAILLKPLQQAIEDRDHIYGIIKGSRVNHGGKTNGFTVPSPTAQAALIDMTFKEANIEPATISYIEAHGTGTALGDPIEITGLAKVFNREKSDLSYPIGSVKSNIGHCESAAGIAAITKVLLQMKNKTLVPSLHSDKSNPNINWDTIPFKVQHELSEWERLVTDKDGIKNEIPRRSTISSFGAGGSNAHMIIEEAPDNYAPRYELLKPAYLISLSAKTEAALKQKLVDLEEWLLKHDNLFLEDISYTLNICRTHFDKRSVFIVSSRNELQDLLAQVNKNQNAAGYLSNIGIDTPVIDPIFHELLVSIQENLGSDLEPEHYRKKLTSLGDLYIKNFDIDWFLLHDGESRNKISLPTYPFAKERYWIPKTNDSLPLESLDRLSSLHPLLDANVSTFEQQCFTKRFTGKEYYLVDHCIHGQYLLPGVVYLEMARKAGEIAAAGHQVIGLKDIVWAKPLSVDNHAEIVNLILYPHESGAVFEAVTLNSEKSESTVHAQGKIIFALSETPLSELKNIDIAALKNRCPHKKTANELYSRFNDMGFHYGPSFQGIEEYFSNETEAVALIRLPKHLESNDNPFYLHPSLLDATLQAVLGLLKTENISYLPFNIDQIDIFGPLPQTCYACVTLMPESLKSHLVMCHIVVTDEAGKVLVNTSNFTLRAVGARDATYYFRSVWEPLLEPDKNVQMTGPILVFDEDERIANILHDKFPQEMILRVKSGTAYQVLNEREYQLNKHNEEDYAQLFTYLGEKSLSPKYIIHRSNSQQINNLVDIDLHQQVQESYYSLFYMIQALVKQKYKGDIQLLCVNESPSLFTEALSGFVKTVHLEHPALTCRIIDLYHLEDLLDEINGQDIEVRYNQDHLRSVKRYQEIIPSPEKNLQHELKKNGVYLISGGMGGLGLIFARFLAEHYQARLILSGRSELGEQQKSVLAELKMLGAEVMYVQSDISKLDDVRHLVNEGKNQFGMLNGVIHSAGITRDAFILKKTAAEVADVLSPKIYGTIYLDEVTKAEPLDFFALFSSVTACFGNLGQCDYAYGNAFEDVFSRYRNELRSQNNRRGNTVSINWPLWAEGGMTVDETSLQWLKQTFGIVPLSTLNGVKAFIDSLALDSEQVIVLPGEKKKLVQALHEKASIIKMKQAIQDVTTHTDHAHLKKAAEAYIKNIVSEVIKLPSININSKEAFDNYGIDSVMIMRLNQKLEEGFGELPKTLFFEYRTVDALADYFMEQQQELLAKKFSSSVPLPVENQPVAVIPDYLPSVSLASYRFKSTVAKKTIELDNHDIAIIGISGRYPQAKDIDAFWNNLKSGVDSVSEIPKERWDNNLYFDPDKDKPGKTYSKWGGFIEDVDKFDPFFFNISPREAELMDPQERLFLEIAWSTIEDAGYTRESLANKKVGVFVGAMFDQYQLFGAEESLKRNVLVTNSVSSYIANRVSYYLDFHGPSITLDTMCSSSLTSIHLACDNLRLGRCQVALAGGVNVSIHPNKYVLLSQGKFLASDGRCRSFGEGGDGYVPAEGVGAVLLKPLEDALADGDHIYGVIKGSSVNHGGKTNGLTVPNPTLQAELIESAFKDANISPDTISYIEAHGTGTSLGDPIEIAGLLKAFGSEKREPSYVIGSVKSNIGHAESAAGIAAVTKVLLQMKNQALVPSLHSDTLNSNINWNDIPFTVQHEFSEWKRLETQKHGAREEIPRRASISSFGAGGSNAHLIIEEAPEHNELLRSDTKPAYLITLSAKTDEALKEKIADLARWLTTKGLENISLEDISYTLNAGRTHFGIRCAFAATSLQQLQDTLVDMGSGQPEVAVFMGSGVTNKNHDFAIFKKVFKQWMEDLSSVGGQEYYDNLLALAHIYVDGYDIDWDRLHHGERKQRISLPTYPFYKLRCWIDTSPHPEPTATSHVVPGSEQDTWIPRTSRGTSGSAEHPELSAMLGGAGHPVLSVTSRGVSAGSGDSGTGQSVYEDLSAFSLHYVQRIFAEILKCPMEQLAPDKTYEVFGIDSIIGITLQKRMEQDFGPLSSTLLYEQNCLLDLSDYLQKHHLSALQSLHDKAGGSRVERESVDAVINDESSSQTSHTESTSTAPLDVDDAIAIIGISGKYPESEDLPAFWENLKNGRDCITRVPENRWRPEDYPIESINGTQYYDQGGFISDVDKFDPLFFNIPPSEASIFMDPQERLFLQTAWSVIEDAGYTRAKLEQKVENKVGVFVGVSFHYYPLYIAEEWFKGNRIPLDIQLYSVANRVSYFFNFNGPSMPIDTACSSSLSAIHLACESIKRGECLMAIAGGVNLSLHPAKFYMLGSTGFMSREGRCTSFGADGTGYVPSEGVGAVLLKPLQRALADKDHIYGVIRASTMNHGGKTSGFSVPNPKAQAALITAALAKSGIDPQTINYMEAHGTGTSLGDPIEIKGLQSAFESYTQDKQFCAIGSVKSNIGHAEAAAGISQVTKVLLQMQHQTLVPSIHADVLNPNINFQQTPFYVQRELSEWGALNGAPRRAGISSFGAGGANVFLIMEEAPGVIATDDANTSPCIFVLSAADADVLYQYVHSFHQFLMKGEQQFASRMKDICYSLQVGRETMPARLALVVNHYSELLEQLNSYLKQPEQFVAMGWANHSSALTGQIKASQAPVLNTPADYERLAKVWVAGQMIPWMLLYAESLPNLVPLLPTYPFVKRRCWVPGQDAFTDKPVMNETQLNHEVMLSNAPPDQMEDWLYTTTWVAETINDSITVDVDNECWLVFGDDELFPLLQMKMSNKKIIHCRIGDQFLCHGVNDYSINPDQEADYQQLFAELIDISVTGILYLWPMISAYDIEVTDYKANMASARLLLLTKYLAIQPLKNKPGFWMVTRGSQAVLTKEPVHIWQHHLWTFANSFALETSDCCVTLIDLDRGLKLEEQTQWLHQLLIRNTKDTYFAFRQGSSYVLRLKRQIPEATPPLFNVPECALVSGGLGALGVDIAMWLIEQGTRFLLLIGNTVLPARDEWNNITDLKLKEKINSLLSLEAKGASICYFAADVADKEKIAHAVAACEKMWNQSIDGIFHLAGVTTDSIPVEKMSPQILHDVLSPKVQGTLVLHELFKSRPLKCFVLFSSVSAVPYSSIRGLSAYATANAFLNGFAEYRRSLGLPVLCIDWSSWAEKGMSVQHHQDDFLEVMGIRTLPVAYGLQLLKYLLSTSLTKVIIQNVNWQQFMQVNTHLKGMPFFEQVTKLQQVKSDNNYHNAEEVIAVVASLFAEMIQLQAEELDLAKPFQEYGLDSVTGIKFILNLNKVFPDMLAQTDLYRYVTLLQLTDYIYSHYQQKVEMPLNLPIIKQDAQLFNEISVLDDEEVSKLLEKELKDLDDLGGLDD